MWAEKKGDGIKIEIGQDTFFVHVEQDKYIIENHDFLCEFSPQTKTFEIKGKRGEEILQGSLDNASFLLNKRIYYHLKLILLELWKGNLKFLK